MAPALHEWREPIEVAVTGHQRDPDLAAGSGEQAVIEERRVVVDRRPPLPADSSLNPSIPERAREP
jgi:hypothetical protein